MWSPALCVRGGNDLSPTFPYGESYIRCGGTCPYSGEAPMPRADSHLAGARFKFTHPQRQSGGPLEIWGFLWNPLSIERGPIGKEKGYIPREAAI